MPEGVFAAFWQFAGPGGAFPGYRPGDGWPPLGQFDYAPERGICLHSPSRTCRSKRGSFVAALLWMTVRWGGVGIQVDLLNYEAQAAGGWLRQVRALARRARTSSSLVGLKSR